MSGPRSRPGRKPSKDQFLFGTPEEVGNRTNDMYTEFVPDENAPSFKQISPQQGGGNVNRASIDHKGGDFKFSSGPGKP